MQLSGIMSMQVHHFRGYDRAPDLHMFDGEEVEHRLQHPALVLLET
jgi:hypothetical protein